MPAPLTAPADLTAEGPIPFYNYSEASPLSVRWSAPDMAISGPVTFVEVDISFTFFGDVPVFLTLGSFPVNPLGTAPGLTVTGTELRSNPRGRQAVARGRFVFVEADGSLSYGPYSANSSPYYIPQLPKGQAQYVRLPEVKARFINQRLGQPFTGTALEGDPLAVADLLAAFRDTPRNTKGAYQDPALLSSTGVRMPYVSANGKDHRLVVYWKDAGGTLCSITGIGITYQNMKPNSGTF